MLNLGLPEILMINFDLKLNILNRINGKETIKWAIKKSGWCFFKIFINWKKHEKKIKIYEILLLKNPNFGR